MKVVCVVLNYNSQDYIGDCLTSLLAQTTGSHTLEVVVVDNASVDDSLNLLATKFPTVKVLRNPTNMGYAGGNNTGLLYALDTGADFAWLVNPDVTHSPDALKNFLIGATKSTQDGILGGKLYFSPGEEFHKSRYTPDQLGRVLWFAGGLMDWKNLIGSHRGINEVDTGQYDRDVETDYVTGASMFIKRRVLEQVGILDANYFLYYEENDLCQRAKRAGFRCMFLFGPTGWHKNAQATGLGSPLQDYFISRNRLLFGLRYAPAFTKLALLRESWQVYQTGRPWQKKGIMDFYAGGLGSGSFQLN